MFVSLRIGVFIRVLVVVALTVAAVALALGWRAQPGPLQDGARDTVPETTQSRETFADGRYRVSGTDGAGLNVRACPDVDCIKVGWIAENDRFLGECWQSGSPVSGNSRWLRGEVDGSTGFVAAHYLRDEGASRVPTCVDIEVVG
ncbi:hypothetical protein ACFS2C_01730 [Prauserella oleivorans]|uniref:SH3 domain-containing protein n=1 Tax=Prauserella oleivorans TaxID=1478153 RepID=A0ABW5W4G5_9PSEU